MTGRRWSAGLFRTTGASGIKGTDELYSSVIMSHVLIILDVSFHTLTMYVYWVLKRVSQVLAKKEKEAWMDSQDLR